MSAPGKTPLPAFVEGAGACELPTSKSSSCLRAILCVFGPGPAELPIPTPPFSSPSSRASSTTFFLPLPVVGVFFLVGGSSP